MPGQGLPDSVRKYRQSVFKLNYKLKKNKRVPAALRELVPMASNNAAAQPAISLTAAKNVAQSNAATPAGATPAGSGGSRGSAAAAEQMIEETSQVHHPGAWDAATLLSNPGQDTAADVPASLLLAMPDHEAGALAAEMPGGGL